MKPLIETTRGRKHTRFSKFRDTQCLVFELRGTWTPAIVQGAPTDFFPFWVLPWAQELAFLKDCHVKIDYKQDLVTWPAASYR